jgi:hippurate hydrolase
MTSPTPKDLLERAHELAPSIVAVRRRIHQRPEQGLSLPETQKTIVEELGKLGLEPRLGKGLSSVTAVIGADRPGNWTVLRGALDALPLREDTGLEFASQVEHTMHACGHDTHVAMLLGGARLLADLARETPDALPGPVLLMFQPGEEGYAGARVMLEEGLLDGAAGTPPLTPENARALAIHIGTEYAIGEVVTRRGAIQASADNLFITVHGRGGHASAPHHAKDPIPVAAEIILALETAITREIDAFDPAVLTVAHIRAGTPHNIIPEVAHLEGTFRCVSAATRAAMPELIRRVATNVAAAHATTADVEIRPVYPVTVNDRVIAEVALDLAAELVGKDGAIWRRDPIMGAEDWSFVLERLPGAMVFLGARPPDKPLAGYPMNHSNLVVFDEAALPIGSALYAAFALAPQG